MPRLSLWRPEKGNDYKFFDRSMSEMFTVGGVDVNIHKYLGAEDDSISLTTNASQGAPGTVLSFSNTSAVQLGYYVAGTGIVKNTTVVAKTATTITLSLASTSAVATNSTIKFYEKATAPGYVSGGVTTIQDLLFLENRDRIYDTSIYTMRAIYRMNDNDFDLSQFGLFLTGDTMFMVFHLNDMVETLGRKIMVGDVMELPHLKDYYPLDDGLTAALKRYYVVQDATRAAEGFAPTWWPHLWRVKISPLVDSQEYKGIINNIAAGDTNGDGVTDGNDKSLGEVIGTLNKYLEINDAIIEQAEIDVPASGYDTSSIYHQALLENGYPADPGALDTSTVTEDASDTNNDASAHTLTSEQKVQGYLTGDGIPPSGRVAAGISFPTAPGIGDYFLRLDYLPNRLFRFDGSRWVKIEDSVRTNLTPGASNKTQRSSFVNNDNKRYSDALGWDAIKIASPYTPAANAKTISFTLSTKSVVTKIPYVSTYGIHTLYNGVTITNTMSNSSGNVGFTVSANIAVNNLLEYTVYANVSVERQSLSQALRPTADN